MIAKMNTYYPAFFPRGEKVVKSMCVFTRNRDFSENVIRHCARLVAKKLTGTSGVDYDEGFTPVEKLTWL